MSSLTGFIMISRKILTEPNRFGNTSYPRQVSRGNSESLAFQPFTTVVMTDCLAVEAGVNAIAFPSVEAIERSETLGVEISFSSVCCSQIYKDFRTI